MHIEAKQQPREWSLPYSLWAVSRLQDNQVAEIWQDNCILLQRNVAIPALLNCSPSSDQVQDLCDPLMLPAVFPFPHHLVGV